MAAIGAAVGTAVISAIIEKLTSFAVGEAINVARSLSHSELIEELESLELKLKLIKNLLDDAESKQNKEEGVRAWLEKLKDAAYDAVDVLDEYATDTAILRRRKGHVRKWIKGKVNTLSMKSKIKRINDRLNGLSDLIDELGLQKLKTSNIEGNTSGSQGRETSSLVDKDWPIIGRDGVQQEIIGLLKSDEFENITKKLPVLAIVGMGGLGKTSLARFVFHDDEVEKHFSLRIWVFVSQEFDLKGLLRKIIEYIYRDKGEREPCKLTTLESLHDETRKLIENKKFLLILDDAWNEQKQHWEELLKPLKFGDIGSKVLVTTRNIDVAKSIDGHIDPITLVSMDDDCILEILEGCAFKGIDNPTNKKNLVDIGKQIVGKLKGSPLAAKTIGRLLGTKLDENHWKMILDSELWEVKGQREHDIIPSLWLSYQYLPPYLKFCFSLCSLFPKGHQISKARLSYIWIAHDIFQDEHGKDLENLAEDALQDLINRSLIFQSKYDDHVVMHDLIHDVSEYVAQEDHLHITDSIKFEKQLTKKLRHLSFSNMNWESRLSSDKLRSVLCTCEHYDLDCDLIICKRVLNRWLHEAKCLRVLDLSGCLEVLPNSIGKLKHLRCLNLSYTGISELPKSLTSLYNLQALWLEDCDDLKKLPDGMGNLVNLRLLSLKYCYNLEKLPDGLENLVNLRILTFDKRLVCIIKGIRRFGSLEELSCFDVDPKNGTGIEELENLNMLRGELAIKSLENVVDIAMAGKACLKRKTYLQGLTLQWTEDCVVSSETAEKVLEALQPNGDVLKSLEIRNYKGRVLPSWLTQDGHLPAALQKLRFDFYECVQSLPQAMRELSNLQSLELHKCHQMQPLPDMTLPASLQQLEIESCESLVSLPSDMRGLTSLRSLKLRICPKIESLADIGLPASLQDLVIGDFVSLTSLPSDMTRLTSLQRLWLWTCPKIESLADIGLPASLQQLWINKCVSHTSLPSDMNRLTSLRTLWLNECPRLQSFPESGLPPSLSALEIWSCPRLQSFPESGLPPSLSTLLVWNCPELQSFPESGLPPSLSTLEICDCPGLQSFPESGLPPSLSTLRIYNCPALEEKYRSGPERALISHIPRVDWGY